MTTLERLMGFFGWPEAEAAPVLAAMAARAGGLDELESLSSAGFASAACRAAIELSRKVEAGSPPLPDRVDNLVSIGLKAASASSEMRRKIISANLAEVSRVMADRPGVPMVLVRHRMALVPIRIAGRMGYQFLPARDLDEEEWSDFEARVCRAAALLMAGKPLERPEMADIYQAVSYTTDATDREAVALLETLGRLDQLEPPADLGQLGTLCLQVLEGLRARTLRELPSSLDLVMGEGQP